MGEFISGNLGDLEEVRLEPERSVDIVQLAEVFEKWAGGGGRSGTIDRPTRITAGAFYAGLFELPRLREAAEYMIEVHEHPARFGFSKRVRGRIRPLPFAEYGANLLLSGFWHELRMASSGSKWTDLMSTYDSAHSAIRMMVNDPEMYENFCHNIAERPIQTTVPNRAVGPRLALEAHSDRFNRPLIISVGHGLGLIEKKLLQNDPFSKIQVFDWYRNTHYLDEKNVLGAELNERLLAPLDIWHCYAMDILPGDFDPASAEWSISNLKIEEQNNPDFMQEVERLNRSVPANYTSLLGDFARRKGFERLSAEMNGEKADIELFMTLWHMLPPDDRRAMLENAIKLLKPGGVILLQDFVQRVDFTEPQNDPINELYFPNDWVPWSYRLLEMDPHNRGLHFEEDIYFVDGRCSAVRLSERYKDLIFKRISS